jgi:acetate---CoA ligase (ADP-forming)
MRDITPLVAPRSIAVIGASTNPSKSGGILFGNLLGGQFSGTLYPINPRADQVMGLKAYPDVAAVPETIDLAYVVLPREHVETAIRQCAEAGVRSACIITAGFAEAGESGRQDQERLRAIAEAAGLLLAGPNTIGMVNAECGMMGSFVNFPHWERGSVSLFTQTGIFTGALMLQVMSSATQRLPVSKSIDVGNKIDVDEIDFLDFVATDPETHTVGFYLESVRRPEEFSQRARNLRCDKPIVVLKPARTTAGMEASVAHTGSPPSDETQVDRLFRDAGVARAQDEEEFVGALRALALLPPPKGRRVGVASTSGALGVIASDLIVQNGLELAAYAPETLERMRSILPDWLEPANPFDFWIGIDVKGSREAHEVGLGSVFADPRVDMVLCTLLAPPNADFPEFGELLRGLRSRHDKPVALVLYGGNPRERWSAELEGARIPIFPTVRAAVRALTLMVEATEEIGDPGHDGPSPHLRLS